MWIIHEPKKLALWNKRHFEEKNGECAACLKYSVLIFVEKIYIKWNIWRVAVRPSYIEDARFLKVKERSRSLEKRRSPSTYPFVSLSLSACPHLSADVCENLIWGIFMKIREENPNLFKLGQKYWPNYVKKSVRCTVVLLYWCIVLLFLTILRCY